MDIKDLAFNVDFREQHPELEAQFRALDAIGGANCKQCDKRKQLKLFRMIESQAGLSATKLVKNNGPLGYELFKKTLRFPEVRDLIEEELGDTGKELSVNITNKGYFDESTELLYKEVHTLYNKNESLVHKLNGILDKDNLRDRLYPKNPKCKVITSDKPQRLENLINEFLLGRKLISLQVSGNSAVIMYYQVTT